MCRFRGFFLHGTSAKSFLVKVKKKTVRRTQIRRKTRAGFMGTIVPSLAGAMKNDENDKPGLQTLGQDKTRNAREREKHRARLNRKWNEPK